MKGKAIFTALAMTVLGAGAAWAQDAELGKGLYMDYCATCHGDQGKGDGDMSGVMTIPASNLTLLAKNNGGTFPMLNVIHVIDGRTGVRAHGGAMPVFGRVFSDSAMRGPEDYQSVVEARGRILSLAMYLESIQQQ
ncbi:c-type cytochrome [Acidimangrovimonas pyrenivorans]|uniref:C-type cytochrome n=1 Tax=Acidimangrovimonas pyrenivorans TaxID=2030798 RepID=A0ABV7ADM9_9RHOB